MPPVRTLSFPHQPPGFGIRTSALDSEEHKDSIAFKLKRRWLGSRSILAFRLRRRWLRSRSIPRSHSFRHILLLGRGFVLNRRWLGSRSIPRSHSFRHSLLQQPPACAGLSLGQPPPASAGRSSLGGGNLPPPPHHPLCARDVFPISTGLLFGWPLPCESDRRACERVDQSFRSPCPYTLRTRRCARNA